MKEDDIIVLILKDILSRWKQAAGMESSSPPKSGGRKPRNTADRSTKNSDNGETMTLGGDLSRSTGGDAGETACAQEDKKEGDEESGDLMETIILRSDEN